MKEKIKFVILFLVLLFVVSCTNSNSDQIPEEDKKEITDVPNPNIPKTKPANCGDIANKLKFMDLVSSQCDPSFKELTENDMTKNPQKASLRRVLAARDGCIFGAEATDIKKGSGFIFLTVYKGDKWTDINSLFSLDKPGVKEFIENSVQGVMFNGLVTSITNIQDGMVKSEPFIIKGIVEVNNNKYPCSTNSEGLKKFLIASANNLKQ